MSSRSGPAKAGAVDNAGVPGTDTYVGYASHLGSGQQGASMTTAPYEPCRGAMSQSTLLEGDQTVAAEMAAVLPPLETGGDLISLPVLPTIETQAQIPMVAGLRATATPVVTAPAARWEATTPPPAPRVICRRLPPVGISGTNPTVLAPRPRRITDIPSARALAERADTFCANGYNADGDAVRSSWYRGSPCQLPRDDTYQSCGRW